MPIDFISPSGVLRRLRVQLRYILLPLALAAVAGYIIWQNVRSAPVRRHVNEGIRLLQNGRDSAAEMQWREAARLDPQNAEVWELLGNFYLNTRNYHSALEAYRHVLRLNSGTPGLQTRMAICAVELQDLTSARCYAQSQLEQNPDDTTALEILAAIEKRANKPEAQLKNLTRWVELQPHNARALTALANELATRREYDKVLPLAERLVPLTPNVANSYLLRGVALYTLNPSEEALSRAEADFHKLAELDPNGVESHRYLARLYLRRNQPLKAIEHYEAISRKRPFASAHFLELSNAYRRAGNARRSEELRALFLHLKRVNARMLNLKDRIDLSSGTVDNYVQLGELLLKSIEAGEADFQLYNYRVSKKQLKPVGYYIDRAVQMRPGDTRIKTLKARMDANYKRHLQAALRSARRRDPAKVKWHMSRVLLLRPDDPRTSDAAQQLASTGLALH
jgi:tetratricopeptide (TPR) repeat protein